MDQKKQELSPELKEIYERVMNTQVKPSAPLQAASTQPATPLTSAPAQAQNPSGQSVPSIPTQTIENKPFVFTGNKVVTHQDETSPKAQEFTTSSRKIPGIVIAAAVFMLVVAWAFFWAKFFGLI